MTGSWSRGAMVLIAAVALVLGIGIWRRSTQAGSGASNTPPAPSATTTPPATATGGTASGSVQAEFETMVNGLREKLRTATDKRAVADEVIGSLQKFADKYPNDKMADQARVTLGQLQMRLGHAPEAVVTLRQVAEHPVDPKVAEVGRFYLAQALAAAGQADAARTSLQDLAKSANNTQIREAAQKIIDQMKATASVTVGSRPPAIQAKDLKGETQTLERYQGKVLLLDFWATWCGPCRTELPNVKSIYEKYHDRGFEVLAVSLDENRDTLERFVKAQSLPWPQLFDGKGWKNEIAQRYGVTSIPKMLLLDRSGVIRYIDARGAALSTAVSELVK
jgi:peroxiredoxin